MNSKNFDDGNQRTAVTVWMHVNRKKLDGRTTAVICAIIAKQFVFMVGSEMKRAVDRLCDDLGIRQRKSHVSTEQMIEVALDYDIVKRRADLPFTDRKGKVLDNAALRRWMRSEVGFK